MKYCYLLCIVLLFSCTRDNVTKSQDSSGITLEDVDKSVIKELKDFYVSLKTASRAAQGTQLSSFAFFDAIDTYTVLRLPYYVFDQEKFYANPSPELLLSNLQQPDERKWFIGMGADTVLFTAEVQDSVWRPRTFIPGWGKVVSWLPQKLHEAGTDDYKIFELGNNIYITFKRNGANVYYAVTGLQEWSEAQFCGVVLDYINQGKAINFRKAPSMSESDKEKLRKLLEEKLKES